MQRKVHLEEAHANMERWLLTYADLITLLLVFFVVMYSISKADERKFAKLSTILQKAFSGIVLEGSDRTALHGDDGAMTGDSVLDDFLGLRTEMEKLAADMGVLNQIGVSAQKEGIAISLSGNLLFDSGRAEIRGESTVVLDKIADRLRSIPNDIRVEGHTDNIQIDSDVYPTNWELSAARATSVTRYLAEAARLPPKRLSAQAFSEYRPVADNNSREKRAMNRRVDLLIVYKD